MRGRRYSIILGILVLIAGLVKGSPSHVHPAPGSRYSEIAVRTVARHASFVSHPVVVTSGESSDRQAKHKEKRHGKSLVSQAIVADCPITILPSFTYCRRNFSLFLPGGCTRQFIGNFSLRGPPVC